MVFLLVTSSGFSVYHLGAWKPRALAALGKIGQTSEHTTSMVKGSTASPLMGPVSAKESVAWSGSPWMLTDTTAAAASKTSPLWNLTPSRKWKRHRSGATCSQPVNPERGTSSLVSLATQEIRSVIFSR